jgi:predicted GNAT superfamily acetyltransferase
MSADPPASVREPGVCQAPSSWGLRILETPEEMAAVEELARAVWPGDDLDVVPAHLLLAVAHNGGLVAGAFTGDRLAGFVFGFPGLVATPEGLQIKHCSHQLGVHPDYRNRGLGFDLKRFQWQIVRGQGIRRVTWTYDPLLSRNAYLNIARLGTVCNMYFRSEYGEMRDGLNAGLPSDRFQVDWWVFTKRVERRLSRRARPDLTLAHYRTADALILEARRDRQPARPPEHVPPLTGALLLVEIPDDFLALKDSDLTLARDWRFYGREVFETAFAAGYLVTDFVHDAGRSFYVLTHGESTL